MPAPAWEDLSAFLSTDDFAALAIFTPAGAPARPAVAGIFDDPHMNADLGEYDLDAGEPRFTCREVDVAGLKKHDGCVIGQAGPGGTIIAGTAYELGHDPYPDGTGMAVVRLAPPGIVGDPF